MEYISEKEAHKRNLVYVDRAGKIHRYGNGTGRYWFVDHRYDDAMIVAKAKDGTYYEARETEGWHLTTSST